MTTIINLYGGPGSGKSTTAAGVFYYLKNRGISCELVTEFAKDVVWEGTTEQLTDQIWVFANQFHRLWKLYGKVDWIITDSPILLNHVYCPELFTNLGLLQCVEKCQNLFSNWNYFIKRTKPFDPNGRMQDKEEAENIDERLRDLLDWYQENDERFCLHEVTGDEAGAKEIANLVISLHGRDFVK